MSLKWNDAVILPQHCLLSVCIAALPATGTTAVPDSVPTPPPAEWFGGRPWRGWDRLTGDWGGARDRLSGAGVEVEAESLVELGAAPGGASPLQLSRVGLGVELPGGAVRGVAELYAKTGRESWVGFEPSHGVSSADAADFVAAGEAWLEVASPEGAVRVRAGRVDANAEFAASSASGAFVNPAFGLSPALDHLPSYPAPAPAATAFVRAWSRAEGGVGVGVFADPAGGVLAVAQLTGLVGARSPVAWTAGVVGGADDGSRPGPAVQGAYVMVEGAGDGVTPFLAAAVSSPGVATATHHLSLGASLPLEAWGVRGAGLAGSWMRPAADADPVADELLVEAFVTLAPTGWLRVQPDVQLTAPLHDSAPLRAAGVLRLVLTY